MCEFPHRTECRYNTRYECVIVLLCVKHRYPCVSSALWTPRVTEEKNPYKDQRFSRRVDGCRNNFRLFFNVYTHVRYSTVNTVNGFENLESSRYGPAERVNTFGNKIYNVDMLGLSNLNTDYYDMKFYLLFFLVVEYHDRPKLVYYVMVYTNVTNEM